MLCKMCKLDKEKEPVSRGLTTRFVDEKNRLWNGKVCPDCYKEYNRARMKLSRRNKKAAEELKLY